MVMSELEHRFESPPPLLVGAVEPEQQLAWLDRELEALHDDLRHELNDWPTNQQVYERLRRDILGQASRLAICDDLLDAALILGGDFRRHKMSAKGETPPLSRDTKEFYAGEAFAAVQIADWLVSKEFDFDYYEHYLQRTIDPRSLEKGISAAQQARWGNELYYAGLSGFEPYRAYWQPVLNRHGELLVPDGANLRRAEAGIGHVINLFHRSLNPFLAMQAGRTTRSQTNWLVRRFGVDLEEVEDIADIGFEE